MVKQTSHTEMLDEPRVRLAVQALMASPDFRLFARAFISCCGVRQTTFTGNALSSAYAQGMQNAGLLFESTIQSIAPELFLQMLKEHLDETTSR